MTVKLAQKVLIMVFNLNDERVLIFLLSIIFIGCTNRTPDEKKDIKIVYATDYSEVGRDFILNKDLDYIFPDSTFVLDGHMKFHPITENEYRLAKMELTTFFKIAGYEKFGYTQYKPLQLRNYFRQYLGYTLNDTTYTYINLYTHSPQMYLPECLCTLAPSPYRIVFYKKDGDCHYAKVIMNQVSKQIVHFSLSEHNPDYQPGTYTDSELRILFNHQFRKQESK